ncbi:response regulator transcription factor [Maritimibacter dapengensis]|uniref:Response regulator transcription factor n=1 Tax=Maritimibacter dapengensis TaxID=2836868 RepID=A0ABS6T5M3_9RHOB|nr:response regulator transcription factor [Maritimibacter dapengensis]MBV7379841.1 response regulator transcription factor [Maritimibacter dapengensis]
MRILIADDHDLLRDTLVAFLDTVDGFETETAADFPGAMTAMDEGDAFDLVLLDLNMPGMNGFDGLESALAREGDQKVALITGNANRGVAEKALALGAAGFLPKTLSAKSLINAVRFMAMGEQYVPIDFMQAKAEQKHPLAEKLADREMQVLKGLTEGKSNKEIARDLDLTEPTIKLYLKTLYRKIDVNNRTQAALVAREAGLY